MVFNPSSSFARTRLFWRTPLAKVVVLFLIGIILPTAFLVYLGLHSIQAETTLLRKRGEERMSNAAGAMRRKMQEGVTAVLTPFVNALQGRHIPDAGPGPADAAALRELQRQQRADLLMMVDAQDRVVFPFRELPPGVHGLPDLDDRSAAELRAAQQQEFQRNDYSAALLGYEALLDAVKSPRWKAALLTRMAACSLKAHDENRVESFYQQIITRYDQELGESGDPFGLTTAVQLNELARRRGRPAEAAAQDLKTFRDLLAGRWNLSWRSEEFHGQRLAANLESGSNALTADQQHAVDDVLERWRQRQVQVERVQEFVRARWPRLKSQLAAARHLGQPTVLLPAKDEYGAIACIPYLDSRSGERRFSLTARISEDALVSAWHQDLRPLASASRMSFRIQTTRTNPLASVHGVAQARWIPQEPVEGVLPASVLETAELRDDPVDRAVSQRQKVYLAMVALAALVILVALYTVWYAVRREMEVAQLKAGFVANMSHELKTPLSIISLIGQTLKLKRYQSIDEVDDYYGMLAEETDRLKGLIDEVLDFSRLMENRKPYHPRKTDLSAVIGNALDRCVRGASPRSVQARFAPPRRPFLASIDPEAMERALVNLFDNAIKYSPPERIEIGVALRSENSHALLDITDKGYGIPADEVKLIFERFYRGRSASAHQKTNGVGLGLSLVRHIIEAHGGTISVRSREDEGSCFTIRIPMEAV